MLASISRWKLDHNLKFSFVFHSFEEKIAENERDTVITMINGKKARSRELFTIRVKRGDYTIFYTYKFSFDVNGGD